MQRKCCPYCGQEYGCLCSIFLTHRNKDLVENYENNFLAQKHQKKERGDRQVNGRKHLLHQNS